MTPTVPESMVKGMLTTSIFWEVHYQQCRKYRRT